MGGVHWFRFLVFFLACFVSRGRKIREGVTSWREGKRKEWTLQMEEGLLVVMIGWKESRMNGCWGCDGSITVIGCDECAEWKSQRSRKSTVHEYMMDG